MMKRIIALVTVLTTLAVLIFSLTSCHTARYMKGLSISKDFNPDAEYEITFWAKNEGHDAQAQIYRRAIEDFNTYYPNIKVNLKIYTNYNDIYKDVLTNIQPGTTPNGCIS